MGFWGVVGGHFMIGLGMFLGTLGGHWDGVTKAAARFPGIGMDVIDPL